MKNIHELKRHLSTTCDVLDSWCQYGEPDFFDGLEVADLAGEAYRLACRHGCDLEVRSADTPLDALRVVGQLRAWAEADRPFVPPEIMTAEETIHYLRLDVDGRDPGERLRNLVRRQGLPMTRRGRLQVFRKTAVDQWLDVQGRSNYAGGRSGGVRPTKFSRKDKA